MVRSDSAEEELQAVEKIEVDDDDVEDYVLGGSGVGGAGVGGAWPAHGQGPYTGRPNVVRSDESLSPLGEGSGVGEGDRRLRRQIANCNERRRMQSINAGFQALRALLPRREGEKLSKAAVLQQTAELITQLQNERAQWRMEQGAASSGGGGGGGGGVVPPKRRRVDVDEELSQQASVINQLRATLDHERNLRRTYEKHLELVRPDVIRPTALPPVALPSAAPAPAMQPASVVATPPHHTQHTQQVPLPPQALPPMMPVHAPQPLSVDVSPPPLARPLPSAPAPPPASPLTPAAGELTPTLTNRSLNAILEAIRHLEGGAFTPPNSHANLLVR